MPRHQWPLEVKELQDIKEDGLEVKEFSMRDIMIDILLTLKKVEFHLSILTNEEIKNHDVGG